MSIFIDMFVLIFMSSNMDMTSGDVTARKTIIFYHKSRITNMYKILKVIFLYFPDSSVERTVIVIHRCYVVLNITLHCFHFICIN